MNVKRQSRDAQGIRFSIDSGGGKVARATSRTARPKVHALYERLGFEKYGVEFRMNFAES